ncbi:unnamed protein product [Parascedosporium putredinis]|uniref:Uncharacterized protein n=1 Tax=Parascedosporium putredinis TaxID=1442378 RepID=A0A9P1H2M5_9PEZI|nr:unnamed protein product [Parascedosporium putredinis]CAI7994955.1 unnamed protein product [Parascedosporium putredinis]
MGSVREPTVVICENTLELRARRTAAKAGPEVCELDLTLRMQGPEALAAQAGDGAEGMRIVKLLLWKELPEWQQRASGSMRECLRSWIYLHNESVNIWSHLIGAVIFFYLPYYMFAVAIPPRYAIATTEDVVVCSAWFIGVAICFVLSVCFHTLMAHSESLYETTLHLDFQGVLVLMIGSTLSLTTYTTCQPPSHRAAHHAVNLALGLSAAFATASPALGEAHLGRYRAALLPSSAAVSFSSLSGGPGTRMPPASACGTPLSDASEINRHVTYKDVKWRT